MDFAQPPPNITMPPPNLVVPNQQPQGFMNRQPFRPFMNMMKPLPGPLGNMTLEDFDGKRLRKSVMRKTVDYNSAIIKELENRVWQRDFRDRRALQPDAMYYPDMMPPPSYQDNPINCVTTKFVKTATNKMRCPIFCMAWTPEGRRLVTGASSGEFTLWNGLTFNFETILQAHDSPVRTMVWSHNDSWMITGDHAGYVKYWQSNMNNVKMFQAHKEALRGISFSPSDAKFVTCSDDGTLRIWDFFRYQEERILRGHGADVKCCHWHPQKGLIISGSKDNQQPIKLWDPKSGQSLATLHAHKSTVMDLKWNDNGNWLITASRDHLLKLFDLRNLSQEVQTFRGHKKEASSVAWHPIHEGLFCSGGSDGSIMFWHVGADKEVGAIEQAHDSIVWTLAWHPLGHILCSGSNDHSSKFWTRNRPGDSMRDRYNLDMPNGIAGLEDLELLGAEDTAGGLSIIPGMGPEDKVEITSIITDENQAIPGLDLDNVVNDEKAKPKKVPFSKPIPRNFQAQWNETANDDASGLTEVINQIVENTPGVVPLQQIAPNAIIIYGKLIPVEPGSKLEQAIADGPDALSKYIASGEIEELHDVMPINDDDDEDYLNDDMDDTYSNGNSNNGPVKQSSNNLNDRDVDFRNTKDQDMRVFNSMGDVDFRNDMDYRSNKDVDLRKNLDFRNQKPNHRDFDLRGNKGPQTMDEDFRDYDDHYNDDGYNDNYNDKYNDKYNDSMDYNDDYDDYGDDRGRRRYDDKEDYSEDYYDDGPPRPKNWQRNSPKFQDFRGGRNYPRGGRPGRRGDSRDRDGGPRDGGRDRDAGPRDGGPRDGGPRDGGPRDGGPRDGGLRDGGLRDGGLRDGGPRDDGPRDGGPRDGGPRDGGPREGGLRDGGPRGGGDWNGSQSSQSDFRGGRNRKGRGGRGGAGGGRGGRNNSKGRGAGGRGKKGRKGKRASE